jgi:hypothetical protein
MFKLLNEHKPNHVILLVRPEPLYFNF